MLFTSDFKNGLWLVGMAPKNRAKTVFRIITGLCQFKVMPFGLCNPPAILDRLRKESLYLDDIIVAGGRCDEILTLFNLVCIFIQNCF